MICPKCNKEKKSNFDKISIAMRKRCIDCFTEWSARPENDPKNNKYVIEYTYTERDEITIYAKSEEEARKRFDEEYSYDYELDTITETKREKMLEDWQENLSRAVREQREKQMGEPVI